MTDLEKLEEEIRVLRYINKKLSDDLYIMTTTINKCIDYYTSPKKISKEEFNEEIRKVLEKR